MSKILVIDDEMDICTLLKKFLSKQGYQVETARNSQEARLAYKTTHFDLILCDYRLPKITGLELLEEIKSLHPTTQVIIITGYSDVRTAVKILKKGAFDYVTKPLYPDEILHTIKNALDKKNALSVKESAGEKPDLNQKSSAQEFVVGKSTQSIKIQGHIDLIAPTNLSVIITGETGTGKEFVARAIHQKSTRADKPFVAIDCGALPKELAGSELFGHIKGAFTGALQNKQGSFESAHTGTLFLDEIGNLSYENQIKLLRVLQERKIKRLGDTKDISIDVRLIAATNEDLRTSAFQGSFREDLYHRLNEFTIELSPLRDRQEDILVYAYHFLQLANTRLGKNVRDFAEPVKQKLIQYAWYGNLRELNNVIKRAVLLTKKTEISLECLPQEILYPEISSFNFENPESDTPDLKTVAEQSEKKAILKALEQAGNNKTKAAEILGIDRKTLYNKLKSFGFDRF